MRSIDDDRALDGCLDVRAGSDKGGAPRKCDAAKGNHADNRAWLVINAKYGDSHVSALSWGRDNATGKAIKFTDAAAPASAPGR